MFNSRKKKHFLARLKQNQRAIWDTEFEMDKMRAIREEIRRSYDKLKEKVAIMQSQIDASKDKKTKKNLKDTMAKYLPDLEQMEKQMAGLTSQVDEERNQDSLVNQLAGRKALSSLITKYLRKI